MKKWMYNVLIIIFAAVFLVSAGYVAWYYIDAGRQAQLNNRLEQVHTQETNPRPVIDEQTGQVQLPAPPKYVDVKNPAGQTISVLSDFAQLYTRNTDMVGWLTIPSTDINYPVMQTPDKADYYLKRNFEKEYSERGSLYVRESCDVFTPSDNQTIYGHHMRDGSMFAALDNYMDKAFYEANPYIFFDTIFEMHTYKIIAVFKTTVTEGEGFAYHRFENAASAAEFDKFVDKCKDLAFYDTGEDAVYGDKLICLSTCEYTQTNGRLVVVAKRIA